MGVRTGYVPYELSHHYIPANRRCRPGSASDPDGDIYVQATVMAAISGPLFHSDAQVAGMLHEIEQDIAQAGYRLVQANLASSLRHPTGHYQSNIRVTREPGGTTVNDNSVIYGPWLEGEGSRNRTTRFKGYFSFRRASQELDKMSTAIAMPIVEQFIRAVN